METVNIATYILDNDPETLDIIRETIDKAGITNYQLFTEEEKFINGLDEEIHVCLVDHKLTKLTGLDILKAVKDKNEFSYVIVYTGMKNPKTIINYLNGDADKFVDKDDEHHLELLTESLKEGLKTAVKRIAFSTFINEARHKYAT